MIACFKVATTPRGHDSKFQGGQTAKLAVERSALTKELQDKVVRR